MAAGSGETSLHALAKEGIVEALKKVIKSEPELLHARDADGMCPLHYAAWYGNVSCVHALLAAGAVVDAFDHDGATALHAAAFNGQLGAIMALIEGGASAIVTDNESQTPREHALKEGHTEVAGYMREFEDDHANEKELKRAEQIFVECKERTKNHKPAVAKATKDVKRLIAEQEKQLKDAFKQTLKARKVTKKADKKPSGSGLTDGPSSFAQLAELESGRGAASAVDPKQKSGKTGGKSTRDVDIMISQFLADGNDQQAVDAFMESLDLKEFSRLLNAEGATLERLRYCTVEDLKAYGLPSMARKLIAAAFGNA